VTVTIRAQSNNQNDQNDQNNQNNQNGQQAGPCATACADTNGDGISDSFVPYVGYTGSLTVDGSVGQLTTVGVTQTFSYDVTGIDPLCESGPGDQANSCGIHIHQGTSCSDDAGGHFYTGDVQHC
jgi:hypothetical protein